jgi:hypothetical protein
MMIGIPSCSVARPSERLARILELTYIASYTYKFGKLPKGNRFGI